jgi:hypothetical protein
MFNKKRIERLENRIKVIERNLEIDVLPDSLFSTTGDIPNVPVRRVVEHILNYLGIKIVYHKDMNMFFTVETKTEPIPKFVNHGTITKCPVSCFGCESGDPNIQHCLTAWNYADKVVK